MLNFNKVSNGKNDLINAKHYIVTIPLVRFKFQFRYKRENL